MSRKTDRSGRVSWGDLQSSGKIELAPGLVHHHSGGVGQVQAATVRLHWNAQDVLRGQRAQQCCGQAATLRAEQQGISGLKARLMDVQSSPRADGVEGVGRLTLQIVVETAVNLKTLPFPIIESGATQPLVVELETQRFYHMQVKPGIGAEANDVAGVGRNFRLIKNDIEHAE